MATWKKLVVSGSAISQLNNDSNYTLNQTAGQDVSGSFSGSFQGDGSQLTGVVATVQNALADGPGIIDFSYDGSQAGVLVSVDSGSLAGAGLTTSGGQFVVGADSGLTASADAIGIQDNAVTNLMLENDRLQIGSTNILLGDTGSSIADLTLTNVTATGSFSGSFTGTTDLPDLTDGDGIADFTYDGSTAASIAVQADGSTLTVGAGGVRVSNEGITALQLATSVAGDGLAGGAGTALSVNVDDSTIEIDTDTLRVKDAGITNAKLANDGLMIGSTDFTLGATGSTITAFTGSDMVGSGSFSGSFEGDGSGLTGIASTLAVSGSTGNDTVNLKTEALTINGGISSVTTAITDNRVAISVADATDSVKGIASFDNSDFTVTAGAVTVGDANGDLTIDRDLTVSRNLTVAGTASFQHTEDLDVADRFIRLASGSNAAGDGGIVIQQDSAANGEAFAFDSATTRWGVTSSYDASTNTIAPDAFMAAAIIGAANDPTAAPSRYQVGGNIFIAANEDIYIYS